MGDILITTFTVRNAVIAALPAERSLSVCRVSELPVPASSCLLYTSTAVTRAKKKVVLVGHKPILFMAVHRADISKRNTMLGERIRLYCKAYHTERNALPELQQAG